MKRFLLLLIGCSAILCSCADATFYEESSAVSGDSVGAEQLRYMYAIIEVFYSGEFVEGALDTLCRINTETGDAVPVCTEPTCDHATPWCTATNVQFFDVTDDGSKVYFWMLKGGQGYGEQAGDGKNESILYEYDTASLSIREIDRTEASSFNFTVLAFDDGVVYNKYVVTETDELGKTLSYKNTLCKYTEENGIEILQVAEELWLYTRRGQYVYTLRPEHVSLLNARMEEIATFGHDAKGTAERACAMGISYIVFWENDSAGMSCAYSLVPTGGEKYESFLLSSNVAYSSALQDYVLIMDNATDSDETVIMNGSEISLSEFTVRCVNPYTGSVLYTVDMTKHLELLGATGVTRVYPLAGRGAQMRSGNVQVFYAVTVDRDAGTTQIPFLFDAEKGNIKRIVLSEV